MNYNSFRKRKYEPMFIMNKKSKKEEKEDKKDGKIEAEIAEKLFQLGGDIKKEEKIERINNHIYFYSEVTRNSMLELILLIKEIEEENISISHRMNIDEIPIYLHIQSEGGSIFAVFSAIDTIQECRVPIHTIIEGSVASAGSMLSIVGKKRFIRPHGYILIHELSSGFWGKFSEIEDDMVNLKELMSRIRTLYQEYTRIPKKKLDEILKHDIWWNADVCMNYGLVDEIWK
jgi:ATP-dependent Clp endopeptidase proteolytic subunit ClpP